MGKKLFTCHRTFGETVVLTNFPPVEDCEFELVWRPTPGGDPCGIIVFNEERNYKDVLTSYKALTWDEIIPYHDIDEMVRKVLSAPGLILRHHGTWKFDHYSDDVFYVDDYALVRKGRGFITTSTPKKPSRSIQTAMSVKKTATHIMAHMVSDKYVGVEMEYAGEILTWTMTPEELKEALTSVVEMGCIDDETDC